MLTPLALRSFFSAPSPQRARPPTSLCTQGFISYALSSSVPRSSVCLNTIMASSINTAKKRKASCDPPPPPGQAGWPDNDDRPGTVLPANLSLADLNRLVDQRVADAVDSVERKTLALMSRFDGLQHENEGLLRRCESLERSVQVLKNEGNWTYSAPDVPRNHWIEQGHDEVYAYDAEIVIGTIQESTEYLRSNDGDEVEVGGYLQSSAIFADNVLNPHWDQLANTMQLNESITALTLQNVQLDQHTLRIIETSARHKGITKLLLDCNEFLGGEGVQFAIDVLKSNRTVEYFCWEDNSFHSTEDACKLVDVILDHPSICRLEIKGSLNEDISPLRRLFGRMGTDTLLKVNLSFNSINTNGDRCIPDFLATNPPLEWLNLEGNQLTDDDALHIAQALQPNTNLRYLDLEDNELTLNGKRDFHRQAIWGVGRSVTSELKPIHEALNAVSEANHTCEIRGISRSSKQFMNDNDEPAKQNRREKLFSLLLYRYREGCTISQLESEFSEDCMGLVPHVIACINTYAAYRHHPQTQCLSILFELARNWKTPEIYQSSA